MVTEMRRTPKRAALLYIVGPHVANGHGLADGVDGAPRPCGRYIAEDSLD